MALLAGGKKERSVEDIVKYSIGMPNGQTTHFVLGRIVDYEDIITINTKIKEKTAISTFTVESAGGVLTVKRYQSFKEDWNYPEKEVIIWQSYKMLPGENASFLIAALDPKVLEQIVEQLNEVRDRSYVAIERDGEDGHFYIDIRCMTKASYY